jgi:hypothetical protein
LHEKSGGFLMMTPLVRCNYSIVAVKLTHIRPNRQYSISQKLIGQQHCGRLSNMTPRRGVGQHQGHPVGTVVRAGPFGGPNVQMQYVALFLGTGTPHYNPGRE